MASPALRQSAQNGASATGLVPDRAGDAGDRATGRPGDPGHRTEQRGATARWPPPATDSTILAHKGTLLADEFPVDLQA